MSVSIVHPWDPWRQAGIGVDTSLDGMVRAAPPDWKLELIGTTADVAARPVGRWLDLDFAGRPVRFYAALANTSPNDIQALPLSLQFALACWRRGVHTSGRIVQFHRFESGLATRLRAGQRAVYFFHSHPPEETRLGPNNVRWRYLPFLYRSLLLGRIRRASLVVAFDPRTPAWVEAAVPALRGQVFLLRQWADPRFFQPATGEDRLRRAASLRERLNLPADTRIVLFVGRLEPEKDPLHLLHAFAELASGSPPVFLLMVGQGRMGAAIDEAILSLGLEARVRRMPSVGRADLADLYRGVDLLACTSSFEGGPKVAFEALASGTPVVSFDVGQIGQVLAQSPDAGALVMERTPSSFCAAMRRVLSSASDGRQSIRCAQIAQRYTPERALAELFQRYPDGEAPARG
ncbi:MAG TPA: glycosyltransferase family 4 protein [Anaerolineales bacterium]|nr:glycosyltransferase family 4 protein [Anaerolineales bacterium]